MELNWNLQEIYNDYNQLDKDIEKLKTIFDKVLLMKGKLNNKESILEYYKLSEESGKLEDKIANFLYMQKSLDGSNVLTLSKMEELDNMFQEYGKKFTFIMDEIKKLPNSTIIEWSKLEEFKDYDLMLQDIIKDKKHTLSQDKEKLMIDAGSYASFSDIFDCLDNVELKFGKTKDENGNIVEITRANYGVLASSNNKNVRKSAANKMLSAYKRVNQTLACNYISHLKYENFTSKTYKYKSTLDRSLMDSDLPMGLPINVVKNVTAFLPNLHKYYSWRKKFMKLDKFESCDLSCDLFDKTIVKTFSLDECICLLKEAFKPLGDDYVSMLDTAIKQNWIDSRYLKNKESGAYSLNVYGVHPFMLLTYDKTYNSVSTFAHEFGHSMHSYYSEKNQPYTKHDYKIFVAEVASTVNEILLANYMINNAKTGQEKITYICELMGSFVGTVFTQTEYTEFELFVHEKIDKNQPLTYKMLNDYYYELQKKYCGKEVKVLENSKYHWSRIPHFYRDFYVFKYATSFISACAIAEKLLTDKNYYKTYRKFLSAGSSKKPCEILKDAGVDILDKKTYASAFKLFDNYVSQLEELA